MDQATKPKQARPPVGIGICILSEEGKILMGQRKGSGLYGFPGGHLERLETWEECGKRELKEETDLDVEEKDIRFFAVNNIIDVESDFHYLDVNLVSMIPKGQTVVNTEPEKCGGWEWWSFEDLYNRKTELFYPIRVLLDQKEIFNKEHLFHRLSQEK